MSKNRKPCKVILLFLGTLPGDVESVAYGINNFGQVVGCSVKMDENGGNVIRHAVIWTVK